jgi:hypothetical protein
MDALKWWQIKPTDRFRKASTVEDAPDCFEYPNKCLMAVFVNETHVANLPYGMVTADGYHDVGHLQPVDPEHVLTWDEVQP